MLLVNLKDPSKNIINLKEHEHLFTGSNTAMLNYKKQAYTSPKEPVKKFKPEVILLNTLQEKEKTSLNPLIKSFKEFSGEYSTTWSYYKNQSVAWVEFATGSLHEPFKTSKIYQSVKQAHPSAFAENTPSSTTSSCSQFIMPLNSSGTAAAPIKTKYTAIITEQHVERETVYQESKTARTRVENSYWCSMHNKKGISEIHSLIRNSVHYPNTDKQSHPLLTSQIGEGVCFIEKPHCDGIIYNGITLEKFIAFIREFSFPEQLIDFCIDKAYLIDHLLYDIGFDYQFTNNKFSIINVSIHGVL